ncbi:MAG: hypothetical protein V3T83_16175 [Acidobacteriota bacterium]
MEDLERAFQHRLRYLRVSHLPAELIEELSVLHQESGHPAVLRFWIRLGEEWHQKRGYMVSTRLAALNLQVGDPEKAFEWLERADQDHTRDLIYLNVDPFFDPLRSDARFEELVRRIGEGDAREKARKSSRSLR